MVEESGKCGIVTGLVEAALGNSQGDFEKATKAMERSGCPIK